MNASIAPRPQLVQITPAPAEKATS